MDSGKCMSKEEMEKKEKKKKKKTNNRVLCVLYVRQMKPIKLNHYSHSHTHNFYSISLHLVFHNVFVIHMAEK